MRRNAMIFGMWIIIAFNVGIVVGAWWATREKF